MDEQTINKVYGILGEKKLALAEKSEKVIEFRYILETKKAIAIQEGAIEGKNAEIRDAVARELLKTEYDDLKLSEYDESVARIEFDLAKLNVERIQALLRLAEVLK